ncbi:hypothetical protein [Nocardioides sp. cx-173]|uniref:hypothetical protein n=1 Tax=Nocardioides sp. cx-173 TaxID=2898796 RepID=UPI001E378030|nr:hypothetical protein [Nocardioides sp. cx-173]MCD4527457.1 hypothetical protein [Nocardioides sp. cx-173]UGB40403.1 hypothetical protein LQ940_13555 [Nocardioides sp. cx-173]
MTRARFVSNQDLARMQASYAHLQGAEVSQQPNTGVGINRRVRDNSGAKSRAAGLREKVNEAIDLAEQAIRREQQLADGQRAARNQDVRRASALTNPRAVR